VGITDSPRASTGDKRPETRDNNIIIIVMIIIIIIIITIKLLHKILEQRTGKARYQGTTESSCTGHSTHTAESANVEAQKSLILQTALCAPLTVRAG
jgi:uncharacterized protein YpmB